MQHRDRLVLQFWNRSNKLNLENKSYRDFASNFLRLLSEEDIKKCDITTMSLIDKKNVSAYVVAKENGILAGSDEFKFLNKDLKLELLKKDGDEIKPGDILIKIRGDARRILEMERISLNLLQRMSGIATFTNELSERLGPKIKIAATRKTLWASLDKKAVSIGGGLTHRLNLSDGILVKDNHLRILGHDIEKAFEMLKNKSKYIEIEVESREQALAAAKAISKAKSISLFAIMFDKIKPSEIKSIIKELKNRKIDDEILFEASGNINEKNFMSYKDCGADIISMGCITNSAKILNMSMEIE